MAYTFEPSLEYIQASANFLKIKENAIPNSGAIPTSHAQMILDQNTAYVVQQFTFYGLALPTDENNLAVAPAKDFIALRTIVALADSYLEESDRVKQWRSKLVDAEKTFRQSCEFFTSQISQKGLVSTVIDIPSVNIRP